MLTARMAVRYLLTRKLVAQVKDLDAALAVSRLVGARWLEVVWEEEGATRLEVLIDGKVAP